MAGILAEDLHQSAIVIDGLIISNWSRDVFEQMHKGELTAANRTCSVWPGFNDTMANIAAWESMLAENMDIMTQCYSAADIGQAQEEE